MLQRTGFALVALSQLAAPSVAMGARITDVADAGDIYMIGETEREDLFDLYFGADFDLIWANGKITREPIDRAGLSGGGCSVADPRECLPVDELRWKKQTHSMLLNAQIGLFHDLALTVDLPVYFGDTIRFRYAKGVGPTNSTVDKKTGNPDDTLFPVEDNINNNNTFRAKRQGLGHLDVGIRFAPLNDERDNSKPNWVVYFKWGMPYTAGVHNPAKKRGTESDPGPMGDGVHRLTFGTALSKRVGQFGLIGIDPNANRRGYTDPYIDFSYAVPLPQKVLAPKALETSREFGNAPSHIVRLNAGLEVVPYEDLRNDRRVAIDIGIRSMFCTEGRSFGAPQYCSNELADALQEIPYAEQYLSVQMLLGLYVQAAEYVRFNLGVGLGYLTEHFLTFENVGKDGSNDGQVLPDDPQDTLNPWFCGNDPDDVCSQKSPEQPSYDQVGFRFKIEEYVFLNFQFGLQITF